MCVCHMNKRLLTYLHAPHMTFKLGLQNLTINLSTSRQKNTDIWDSLISQNWALLVEWQCTGIADLNR